MRNNYGQELMELKASFRKALIFCAAFNVIVAGTLLTELAGALLYDPAMGIGEVLLGLVITIVLFGWLISCLGFSIVNYRYTRNPMASIWECLQATISGKKHGIAYAWKGPLNAMEILSSIRDLKSMAAARNNDNAVMTRAADF
jgi:hypothetical protein